MNIKPFLRFLLPGRFANDDMLDQFKRNVEVALDTAVQRETPDTSAVDKVKALLKKPDFTWNDAYQAEKSMAQMRVEESLNSELDKQIASLAKVSPDAQALYQATWSQLREKYPEENLQNDGALATRYTRERRSLLERVLNDVHWKYAQRYHNRKILEGYASTVSWISVALVLCFLGTIILACSQYQLFECYAGLSIAITTGLLGASFSMLTGAPSTVTHTSIELMLAQRSLPYIGTRIGVGGIAAVALYFLFETGLLEGSLVPSLQHLGFAITAVDQQTLQRLTEELANAHSAGAFPSAADEKIAPSEFAALAQTLSQKLATDGHPVLDQKRLGTFVPNAQLSKLLVWSFLAGFSEKLVPTFLGRFQATQEREERASPPPAN